MKARAAYTLIEVLVAAAILMIAVSAAGVLALASITQEEINARIARCVNLHEQAARLYQLGLEPAEVDALLLPDPAVVDMPVFTVQTVAIPGLGTIEQAESTLTYATDSAERTHTILSLRPSLR